MDIQTPSISFEQFKSILEKIRDIKDAETQVNNICRNLNYKYKEYAQAGYLPNMSSDIITLLEIVLDDKGEWISYWCWEKDFGRRTDLNVYESDGTVIPMTTIEELWAFLLKNRKEHNSVIQS